MIKINLLPAHILESRRVKKLMVVVALFLIIEAFLLAAYVFAPPMLAPFALPGRLAAAEERLEVATREANAVREIESETNATRARFSDKNAWVGWVESADRLPELWIKYFETITRCVPADVVITGLQAPMGGGSLQLSGYTRDQRSATRWYLHMLRSDIVDTSQGINAVSLPAMSLADWPAITATGPMDQPVTLSIAINPGLTIDLVPPSPPANATISGLGGRVGARGAGRGVGTRAGMGAPGGAMFMP